MARKTKQPQPTEQEIVNVLNEVPPEPEGPQDKYLTKDEMHKLQVAQLQVRAAEAEMNYTIIRRDNLLKEIDPEGKLKEMAGTIRSRANEAAVGKDAYSAITKEIETRLGINLKEFAYNDENGLLQKVD